MPLEPQAEKEFTQTWQGVAYSINLLPEDQREQYRKILGVFMHDMKHTLGLITNANELIRRDIQQCPEKHKSGEMISIVHTAARQLDAYFNTIVEACCNQIDIGEE